MILSKKLLIHIFFNRVLGKQMYMVYSSDGGMIKGPHPGSLAAKSNIQWP